MVLRQKILKFNGHDESWTRESSVISNNTERSHLIDVTSEQGKNELIKLLEDLKFTRVKDNGEISDTVHNKSQQVVSKIAGGEDPVATQIKSEKQKLTSGRATKPDKSDIKKQVKFAHEKLDSRHIKERIFDNLTFPLLIAGELELASQPNISGIERQYAHRNSKNHGLP